MKKIISILVVLAMLMAMAPAVFAEEEGAIGTAENPYALSAGENEMTVAAGATSYGNAYFNGSLDMTVTGTGSFTVSINGVAYSSVNGVVSVSGVSSSFWMPASVKIVNNSGSAVTYSVVFTAPVGDIRNPAELVIGMNTASITAGSNGYFFNWVAAADGTLTITMPEGDWAYAISNYGPDKEDWSDDVYGDTQWSDSNPVVNPVEVEVSRGDILQIMVNSYDPDNEYSNPAAVLVIYAEFETEESDPTEPQQTTPEETEPQQTTPDETEPEAVPEHIIADLVITEEGVYDVTMENANVTIVTFTPDETGVYTISVSNDAVVGCYGYGSYYIYSSAYVEHDTSLEWTCSAVGQSYMVGIVSSGETVSVTVKKADDYELVEIPLQVYENQEGLEEFDSTDWVIGDYVDVYGDTIHTAVLGEDGYYHLDSADGAILLIDLDYMITFSDALNEGRGIMYAVVTDEDGNIVEKWDIGEAFREYEKLADKNGCYPLTEDLIFFYQVYGGNQGYYHADTTTVFVKTVVVEVDGVVETTTEVIDFNEECAWMFACLTAELSETTPDETEPEETTPDETEPVEIPEIPEGTVEIGAEGSLEYIAGESGTLTVTLEDEDAVLVVHDAEGNIISFITGSGTIEVSEGTVYLFSSLSMNSMNVTFNLNATQTDSENAKTGDETTVMVMAMMLISLMGVVALTMPAARKYACK